MTASLRPCGRCRPYGDAFVDEALHAGWCRPGGVRSRDVGERRTVITAAEMALMTPQQRAGAVAAGVVTCWDDVTEPFRSDVLAEARRLGEERRAGG